MTKPSASLVLEDGTVLHGSAFGAAADTVFELVFNTSMTGYQEIISDPSYRGQGVLFTTSHIGNTGINQEDDESAYPQVSAVVLRALSPITSNWRSTTSLPEWMASHGVPGVSGVDTRWLTRRLRDGGTQKAALSTQGTPTAALLQIARQWPGLDGRDMVLEATCPKPYTWEADPGSRWVQHVYPPGTCLQFNRPLRITAYDFGIKRNILRHLAALGAQITVVPANTPAQQVLASHPGGSPDGVFLSNGPGDPAGLPSAVETVRQLVASGVPLMGICLGHQLLGLALGGRTRRLKFGHHGGNHPVLERSSRKVLITAQNHNYCVEADSLDAQTVEITHHSLNDLSVEGMRLRGKPVFSVQFHPEAAPGPHDAHGLFDAFFRDILAYRQRSEEA